MFRWKWLNMLVDNDIFESEVGYSCVDENDTTECDYLPLELSIYNTNKSLDEGEEYLFIRESINTVINLGFTNRKLDDLMILDYKESSLLDKLFEKDIIKYLFVLDADKNVIDYTNDQYLNVYILNIDIIKANILSETLKENKIDHILVNTDIGIRLYIKNYNKKDVIRYLYNILL